MVGLQTRYSEDPPAGSSLPPEIAEAGTDITATGPTEEGYTPGVYSTASPDIVSMLRTGQSIPSWGDLSGTKITLYPPYGGYASALFPPQVAGTGSFGQYAEALWSMSQADVYQIQNLLWRAGYYGEAAIMNDQTPRPGIVDGATTNAWSAFLMDTTMYSTAGITGDELLIQRINSYAGLHEAAAMANRTLPTYTVSPTDTAQIEVGIQEVAQAKLGRRLTPDEATAITTLVSGEEIQALIAKANVQRGNDLQALGFRRDGTRPTVEWVKPEVMLGGNGPDTVAARFSRELASMFQTSVMASDGLTVKIGGSESRLRAVAEWAAANGGTEGEGDAGVVAHYSLAGLDDDDAGNDHIVITYREGAMLPPVGDLARPIDRHGEVDRFLGAVRIDDSPQNYHYKPTEGDFGAYGLSDNQMTAVLRRYGAANPEDRSPQAQDFAARMYASELFEEFGDWRMVAIAFRSSRDVARQLRASRTFELRADNSVLVPEQDAGGPWSAAITRYLQRIGDRMGSYRPPEAREPFRLEQGDAFGGAGASVLGGATVITPDVNPAARAQQELERTHGAEIGATTAARSLMALFDQMGSPGQLTPQQGVA